MAADAVDRVAVPALHELDDNRALELERRAAGEEFLRRRVCAQCVHVGRPGGRDAEVGEESERDVGEDDGDDGDRAAAPGFFSGPVEERDAVFFSDGTLALFLCAIPS